MLSELASAVAMTVGLITYKDGILRRFGYTDNGKGTMTKGPIEAPCLVQVDALTQSQLAGDYAEDDVRLLILSDGLDSYLDNGRVQDDDELYIPELNVTYRIAAPSRDPVDSHWSCRGRIKPNA
jgi:hypothetical protein